MSDFFDPPAPPPPRPRLFRQPEWLGPPRWTLPGAVPLELVLAQTNEVVIAISRVDAYPSGFEFDVLALAAPDTHDQERFEALMFGHPMHGPRAQPDALRVGVQFANGGKATNVFGRPPPATGRPTSPVMQGRGGGGGGGRWHFSFWIWPLPPPGPLAFVCEWPALDVPVTRHEVDAQPILDAAARAQVVFSDEDLPEPPAGPGANPYCP